VLLLMDLRLQMLLSRWWAVQMQLLLAEAAGQQQAARLRVLLPRSLWAKERCCSWFHRVALIQYGMRGVMLTVAES